MAMLQSVSCTTDMERLIYKRYECEKTHRIKLEEVVKNLTKQVADLQRELKIVREANNASSTSPRKVVVPPPAMYETDEEELAQETEWVRQISRKKRKMNKSPSPQPTHKDQEKPKVKKAPLPPPIVVEDIKNYQQFYDLLSASVNKDTFLIKMLSGENVKINASNEDSYRVISKLLTQKGCLWHSYENKQDRPIRVMAKNLHSSCSPERIIEDLTDKGFKILEAVNKLKWKNKEPLNMWTLSFQKDEEVKNIYEIRSILGCKVDIQPLKTSKLIPQCKRCQSYGHTQKYCSKEPRCVKCTGKHLTINCDKPADVKPKCIHCGEAHPANYRGCIVAKELQNIRNKQTKPTTKLSPAVHAPIVSRSTAAAVAQNNVTNDVSYAQIAVASQQQKQAQIAKPDVDQKLTKILLLMSSFDERLKKLEAGMNKAPQKSSK